MLLRTYDILDDFDASDAVGLALAGLPQWRLMKALSFRQDIDKFLCAQSFLMLGEMLREGFGLYCCPEFSYGPNGKPFLKEYPSIHFNISHCRRGIACAVSDNPIGIDIEVIQYDEDLVPVVFNSEERDIIESSAEPDVKFTELWTRKESYLKLKGEGISDNLKDALSTADGVSFKTEVNRSAGYVLSVASISEYTRGESSLPLI